MDKINYIEPHLLERIKTAKKHAAFIKNCTNITDLQDAEMVLRFILSKHYRIPIFSDYFEKLTIDQLFFEVELISETTPQSISQTMEENKDEISNIADEMENEWNSAPMDEMDENDPFFQLAREFMKTGKYVGEQENEVPQQNIQENNNIEEADGDWQRTDLDRD